jgi:hypothetical protein
MAISGKRKKSKKPSAKARKIAKPKKTKKSAAQKKVKAPVKRAKRLKKKVSKCAASPPKKATGSALTVEQIAPSGEPEFVSNASLLKL